MSAASRFRPANQVKTPLSSINFQIAPCPPGFIIGDKWLGKIHLPDAALTTGTIGWHITLHYIMFVRKAFGSCLYLCIASSDSFVYDGLKKNSQHYWEEKISPADYCVSLQSGMISSKAFFICVHRQRLELVEILFSLCSCLHVQYLLK